MQTGMPGTVERSLVAETRDGVFRGSRRGSVLAFEGIRYAKAPAGPLRLSPPQDPDPVRGIVDATAPGPAPPQIGMLEPVGQLFGSFARQAEDCLTLNVRTPALGDRRPVIVWVHGGGFALGAGSHPLYGNGAFARAGLVEVTLNYRLGMIGFAHVDDAAAPANRGLLDVLAALRWIQRNIAAFGGDPSCVTLAGHSAGAMLVAAVVASPASDGLVARAILQSGAASNAIPRELAAAITDRVLGRLGDVKRAMNELPVTQLLTIQRRASEAAGRGTLGRKLGASFPAGLAWQPVIGPDPVAELPLHGIASSPGRRIPVLSGTVRDEGWMVIRSNTRGIPLPMRVVPRIVRMLTGLELDHATAYAAAFTARRDRPSGARALADVVGDIVFRAPAARLARKRAAAGGPVYDYIVDEPARTVGGQSATIHGAELPYLFDAFGVPQSALLAGEHPAEGMAERLRGLWCHFATHGHPTPDDAWPPHTQAAPATAVLRAGSLAVENGIDRDLHHLRSRLP